MTIARDLGRRVGFYVLIAKVLGREWLEIRKECDAVVATGAVLWAAFFLYMVVRTVDGLVEMAPGDQ